MSAFAGPAAPDVASLHAYIGVLPEAVLVTLLIMVFEKAVSRAALGEPSRILSRCVDVALAPLAFGALVLAGRYVSNLTR
jgi:hypothetical protein